MSTRLPALVVAVTCFVAARAQALDPRTDLRHYVRANWQDALPQRTILSLLQSRDGYVWIATYSGLARFDGVDFHVFDPSNSALAVGAISALAEDPGGTLWVGTVGGGLYRFAGGTFTRVAPDFGEIVYALATDDDGRVWVGANRGFGYVAGDAVRRFTPADGVPAAHVRAIKPDGRTVWIGTEGAGLLRYADGAFTRFTDRDGLSSNYVYALATAPGGRVWIGLYRGGLNVWRDGRIEATRFDHGAVYALTRDPSGALWLAVEGAGLCRLASERMRCDALGDDAAPDLLRCLLVDRDGALWAGGTNSGLHRLADAKVDTITAEASNNHVRSVVQDATGVMWAGLDGDGLWRVRDAALEPFTGRLPDRFVRSLAVDRRGDLWVGTLAGLARVRGGAVTTFTARDGVGGNFIYAIYEDRAGALWVGTSNGLSRKIGDAFAVVVPNVDVRAIFEDRHGRVWIGRRDGLACFEGDRVTDCGVGAEFRGTAVFGFHEDEQGSMWLATGRGIARVRSGALTRYRARDGLPDDTAFAILSDRAGRLWISSNKGLYRVAPSAFEAFDRHAARSIAVTLFGKADGMAAAQCNGATQPAAWKSRDGRLWFATVKGLVVVDADRLTSNPTAPTVAVTGLAIDRPAKRVEIAYTAPSFIAPDRVRFRYRLDSFDRDWVDAGARRTAFYTNLPPGDYVFHATAANEDGVWNPIGTSIAFQIAPFWYETRTFRAAVVLTLTAALVAGYRVRIWRVRARERLLTTLVEQRTEELRLANAELERLSVVDPLTGAPNRRAFDRALDSAWLDHRRRHAALAMLLCDVDHFKRFNDRYGHPAGDAALTAVVRAARAGACRANDVVARIGGEEIAALLPNTTLDGAEVVAAAVLDAVRALAIPHAASDTAAILTLSIGVAALTPDATTTPADLIQLADAALYRAKASGKNRAALAEPITASV